MEDLEEAFRFLRRRSDPMMGSRQREGTSGDTKGLQMQEQIQILCSKWDCCGCRLTLDSSIWLGRQGFMIFHGTDSPTL
jgi:hypothetical protein